MGDSVRFRVGRPGLRSARIEADGPGGAPGDAEQGAEQRAPRHYRCSFDPAAAGGRELDGYPNFGGSVLGCIEADFVNEVTSYSIAFFMIEYILWEDFVPSRHFRRQACRAVLFCCTSNDECFSLFSSNSADGQPRARGRAMVT